jgi:hypothetical protein
MGSERRTHRRRDVSRWAFERSNPQRYQNLTKSDLKAAFKVFPNCSREESEESESAVSA